MKTKDSINEVVENNESSENHMADSPQGKKTDRAKRTTKNIPSLPFEDSLVIAEGIWTCASGHRVRRLTLFDHLGKSPDSGTSRKLVTASSRYGITTGGYQAEYIELTQDGSMATNPDGDYKEAISARFRLAIQSNTFFNTLYESMKGMKLPSTKVMEDTALEAGLTDDEARRCVETFVVNAKYVGLVRVLSGAERLISIEQLLEETPSESKNQAPQQIDEPANTCRLIENAKDEADYENICFYITPIGEEGTEVRKHSDMMLECVISPVLEEFNLKAVRADKIAKPGLITNQILDYITKSKMVIADLSFHNPNVFYELAVRHMKGLPTIHLCRTADTIPFDISGFRTITLDMTDIYSFVPQLETYKSQISSQLRGLLEANGEADNPISAYLNR